MAFLGFVALGYLAASFVVSFYFAARAWGTAGTVLTIIIMATFPATPIWFAQNGLWSQVAVCCALLIINSLMFWSVQTTERVSRRGRLLAATVLGVMVIPSVAAPYVMAALGPHLSERQVGQAMLVSVLLLLVLGLPYIWWLRTGRGNPRPARSVLRVPKLLMLGIAPVGHLTAGQFLAFALLLVIAMYGLWGVLSVWFYPLDDARIDITVREIAGLARDRLLLRYSVIATVGAIGAGLVMWKAGGRKRSDKSHDQDAI